MNAQIEQEAAEWLIDIRADEPDARMREQFAAWLRASPEHVRAYLELVVFWEDASFCDRARALDVDSLIALAQSEGTVVELDFPSPASRTPRTTAGAPRYRFVAAAVVSILAVGIIAWLALTHDPIYATELAEQRSIRLADGSSVELNALSRIRVRFSDHERAIDLLSGQALFRVAKDQNRPFIVASAEARVRAVGTQFDVNRKRSRTIVTVLEGRVAILPQMEESAHSAASLPTPRTVEVAAGEQAIVGPIADPDPQRTNVVAATAWTQKQLIFESMPLPDVAEEFNRFNTRQLVIESPSLADFHMSGTFPADDPASLSRLLRFLRDQPGIEINESDDRILVRKK